MSPTVADRQQIMHVEGAAAILKCGHTRRVADFNKHPLVGRRVRCFACEKVEREMDCGHMSEADYELRRRYGI